MQDAVVVLTPESLERALSAIDSETDEVKCAAALVTAATLLQEAVLNDQSPESVHEAMDRTPDQYHHYLREVCNRAVDFHRLEDGGQLGFWLYPVLLGSKRALPPVISLETKSTKALRTSSAVLKQFDMVADTHAAPSDDPLGWNYVLPTLFAFDTLADADLGELVRLPHQARGVVRGAQKRVSFKPELDVQPASGQALLYFFPVIVYHPPGKPIDAPAASEEVVERLTAWIEDSMPAKVHEEENEFTLHVSRLVYPFTTAQVVGRHMRSKALMHATISKIVADSSVSPNGMAALIALYAPRQAEGELVLGVSLSSRLTGAPVATVNMRVDSEDGGEEVALVTYILNSMGMSSVQRKDEPIDTIICQHCGGMQFLMPNQALAQRGVEPAKPTHH